MIKKLVTGVFLLSLGLYVSAQERNPTRNNTYTDEGPATGFSKQNLFIGGNLGVGFSTYSFNIGAAPEIGYSLTNWLDAGVLVNLNYYSIRADPYYNNDTRYRSFNYGAGAFARMYPLPFLFFSVQPEYNWISYNQKYMPTGQSVSANTEAASLLLGVGYGQRVVGQGNFFISVSFDILDNQYSPYRDYNRAAIPVIRAGFDFYLHKSR